MAKHCYQPGFTIHIIEGRDRTEGFPPPVREYRSLDSARARLRESGISESGVDEAISLVSKGCHTKIDYLERGGEIGLIVELFPYGWTNNSGVQPPHVELKLGDHSEQ
jgi:hypothetical protein